MDLLWVFPVLKDFIRILFVLLEKKKKKVNVLTVPPLYAPKSLGNVNSYN